MDSYTTFPKPVYKKTNINNLQYLKCLSYKSLQDKEDTQSFYTSYIEFLANNVAIKKKEYLPNVKQKLSEYSSTFKDKFNALTQSVKKSNQNLVEKFKQRLYDKQQNNAERTSSSTQNKNETDILLNHIEETNVETKQNNGNEENADSFEESVQKNKKGNKLSTTLVEKIKNSFNKFKNFTIKINPFTKRKSNNLINEEFALIENQNKNENAVEETSNDSKSSTNKITNFFTNLSYKAKMKEQSEKIKIEHKKCERQIIRIKDNPNDTKSYTKKYIAVNSKKNKENEKVYFKSIRQKCNRLIYSIFKYLNEKVNGQEPEEIDYNALYGKKESRIRTDESTEL